MSCRWSGGVRKSGTRLALVLLRKRFRWSDGSRVAAIACAAALIPGAVLAATSSPSARAAAASTPRCATSGLVVWMDTQGGGATGSIYYTLEFTNLSGQACTLHGSPGVSAVTLSGRRALDLLGPSGHVIFSDVSQAASRSSA
jgi:hypothetical protein